MAEKSEESILDKVCCCLTLRQGTILVGIISLIVDILIIVKSDIVLYKGGQSLNGFDYILLILFGFGEIPQDILVITAAFRESAKMFQGHSKVSYVFSNFYTILLVIFCDRAWNQSSKVINAVIIYVVYCGILGAYFFAVIKAYGSKLNKEAKQNKQLQTQNVAHA